MSKMGKREGKNRPGQGLSMGKLRYPTHAKTPLPQEFLNSVKDPLVPEHPVDTSDLDREGISARENRHPTRLRTDLLLERQSRSLLPFRLPAAHQTTQNNLGMHEQWLENIPSTQRHGAAMIAPQAR